METSVAFEARSGAGPTPGYGSLPARQVAAMCDAMDRALASGIGSGCLSTAPAPLLVVLSATADDLCEQVDNLALFPAGGVTVVVGVGGPRPRLDRAIHVVDVTDIDDLSGGFARIVVDGSFGAAIVGIEESRKIDERFRANRGLMTARWTFDRTEAVRAVRQLLRPMRENLPREAQRRVNATIEHSLAIGPTHAEEQLAEIANALVACLALPENESSDLIAFGARAGAV